MSKQLEYVKEASLLKAVSAKYSSKFAVGDSRQIAENCSCGCNHSNKQANHVHLQRGDEHRVW